MAQHDYNIANQSGADFRADLNNALLAIATVNSGSTEPSTTFAHQLWVDTSSSVLKIRNAADNAWITTGVSITASNTFTGDLTGDVTGNLTGNVTGNVTGDLTGNADSADILTTARTISLSGDVVGSVSFDGSTNVDIDTVVQINSITLGTDTTGDYVESMSGGTGVIVTGGTGEGSTPSIAIGQSVATTDNVTFNLVTATDEFIGDIDGAVRFSAKADEALTKGDVIYITGVSGNTPTIAKAKADDASKMPAFGIALQTVNANAPLQIVTLGTIESLDTSNESVGEILYVSTTAGEYTTTIPTGETTQIQNIGKVLRSHATVGSIRVGGAGRSNATPNLNNGKIFIGNASNQSVTATLDTSIVVENTNLYYTTTRANTDFDTRLATKDTGDLTEGSNLYYTTARVNSDFDTRLATKSTTNLAEGSNLYYTDARVNSAFDTRLATKDTDDLTEGTTNLYYTSGRANTDFDTRLATKSTTNLAEGTNLYYTSARFDSAFTSKDTDDLSEGTTNLYYTTARFDSAFGNKTTSNLTEGTNLYYTTTRANSAIDTRVTKAFVDALGIQATSVAANSVTLGTDTVGNYVATVTGTANKITVSGSGSESANITLSLPDDVQIADSLTVAGNLTVNGTLTSLDTTNLDIEDNLFQLNAGLTGSPVNDSGMLINRGTSDNSIFMWDESVDKFTMGLTTADGSATGNITLNSLGTLVVNVEGNLTGNVTGTVSSISNHSTSDLSEGTNLYYTQARFDSALAAKSTTDLSEGTNLYYTDARFDTRLASKDTDDVSEGTSNLYYTSTRFDSAFGGKSTSDLSEGTNLYYTDARVQAVSINNVVEDTTPQLGGDLDLNSSDITGTGDINITGTITSSGNITGTLATAAQPNITSLGTLTGLTSTGNLVIGTEDNNAAIIEISGGATGSAEGGEIRLDTAADYDSTYEFYRLDVSQDDFRIGRQGQTDFTLFSDGTAQFFGNLAATLSTAAQPNVTSVGTLSGLTVSGDLLVDTNTLFVDASEDVVGINTTSNLNQTLNVLGTSSDTIDETTGVVKFEASGGNGLLFGTQASSPYRSYIQSAYTIDTSLAQYDLLLNPLGGKVGIGTTSPADKVQILDSGNLALRVESSGASNQSAVWTENNSGTINGMFMYGSSHSGYGAIGAGEGAFYSNSNVNIMSDSASGVIKFSTGSSGGTEKMRIASSGNVGIGTTSPTSAYAQPSLHIHATGNGAELHLTDGTTGATATDGMSVFQYGLDSYIINREAGDIRSYTDGSERMRINSSGNVGINATSIAANGLQIGNTSSTDTEQLYLYSNKATFALEVDGANNAAGTIMTYSWANGGQGSLRFKNASGEVARLDSSGNLLFSNADTVIGSNTSDGSDNQALYLCGGGNQTAGRGANLRLHGNEDSPAGDALLFSGSAAGSDILLSAYSSTSTIQFATNGGSERMRIDSSGNVGIGTTPAAHSSLFTALDIDNTALTAFNDVVGIWEANTYYDGSNYKYRANGYAGQVLINNGGEFQVKQAVSGTAGASATLVQNFTIDNSGNVGIGETSPLGKLHVKSADSGAGADAGADELVIEGSGDSGLSILSGASNSGTILFSDSGDSAAGGVRYEQNDNALNFRTNGAWNRLIIDSSGNVLVGTTNTPATLLTDGYQGVGVSGDGYLVSTRFNNPSAYFKRENSNGHVVQFLRDASVVGSVSVTTTATAYNTSSDYRLKENVDYDFTALDRVAQLKPARFNFIADEDTTVDGFLAHEVQDIVPEAVTGEKDAMMDEEYEVTPAVLDDDGNVVTEAEMGTREVPDYQGIDQSKLVPLLTKAIQEQQTLIENLTARIEELEN